ncbi:hypothetical protein D3C77_446890 [compost metagenome]
MRKPALDAEVDFSPNVSEVKDRNSSVPIIKADFTICKSSLDHLLYINAPAKRKPIRKRKAIKLNASISVSPTFINKYDDPQITVAINIIILAFHSVFIISPYLVVSHVEPTLLYR